MTHRTLAHPTRRQCLLGAVALAATAPGRAQPMDLAEAINQAGRQRMLSQRVAKAWLALAIQVLPERAQPVLAESVQRFEQQLASLRAFGGGEAVQRSVAALGEAWVDYRRLLDAVPSLAAAPALLQADARVLELAQRCTQQLEGLSSVPTGRLINLAGRQRMLSQRMAKYRLAAALPALAADARLHITQARGEFIAGLEALERAPQATRAIQDELALARGQWVFFDLALGRAGQPGGRDAAELFITSEHLLQSMDRVTALYARLGA